VERHLLRTESDILPNAPSEGNNSHPEQDDAVKDHENNLTEIYVGNHPHDCTVERLERLLCSEGIHVTPESILVSARRGYAVVKLDSGLAPELLTLDGLLDEEGRRLIVQKKGEDPLNCLRALCKDAHVAMPSISVHEVSKNEATKFIGLANWDAMGGVLVQSPRVSETRKIARQAAALACLDFFEKQTTDNFEVPGQKSEHDGKALVSNSKPVDCISQPDRVPLVLNLIDSPGHIDFNAEVTAALRVTDGALVVVDAVEGKAVQTDEVLRQALREGVKPVLMINKCDRLFIEQQKSPEDSFDRMQQIVDDINRFISDHQQDSLPNHRVSLFDGSACFGSGYYGWGCSASTYQRKGATAKREKEQRLTRETFIKEIMRPIVRMHRACGVLPTLKKDNKEKDRLARARDILSCTMSPRSIPSFLETDEDNSDIDSKKLLKKTMMAWLPAADVLVDMIAEHVPSPVEAQTVRAPLIYTGDTEDECGKGISACDPLAPTVVYVCKMTPSLTKKNRMLGFGRVFSGQIKPGDVLRALRADGIESKAKVSQVMICGIGGKVQNIECAQAGQLVVLDGVDEALGKAGTLTSSQTGKSIRHMNFTVTPVVRHSVKPKDKAKVTKMVSELQQIVKADSTALFFFDKDTKEHILAGAGELHIEILVSSLQQNTGIEVELSEPVIAFRETVQSSPEEAALAKSDNKHNRLWFKASPLSDDTIECLRNESDGACLDLKVLGRSLVSNCAWSAAEASRIWAVGPEATSSGGRTGDEDQKTCVLVDSTFGLQIPQDAKENIITAFSQVTRQGVLVNAAMRGVRFDLVDAKFHSDSVHRRPNSVVPAATRAMRGAFLMACPGLVEPMYRADVSGSSGTLNAAYSILGRRGGVVVDARSDGGTDTIQARLPVRCSFGLAGEMRGATHGQAHYSCVFDGMQKVPAEEEATIIERTRTGKGLKEGAPVANDYLDKL